MGDLLALHEWTTLGAHPPPSSESTPRCRGHYTERRLFARVRHIARGPDWGIPTGYVVLSLRSSSPNPDEEDAAATDRRHP